MSDQILSVIMFTLSMHMWYLIGQVIKQWIFCLFVLYLRSFWWYIQSWCLQLLPDV